jgi:arginine decarboxylase-like protein
LVSFAKGEIYIIQKKEVSVNVNLCAEIRPVERKHRRLPVLMRVMKIGVR